MTSSLSPPWKSATLNTSQKNSSTRRWWRRKNRRTTLFNQISLKKTIIWGMWNPWCLLRITRRMLIRIILACFPHSHQFHTSQALRPMEPSKLVQSASIFAKGTNQYCWLLQRSKVMLLYFQPNLTGFCRIHQVSTLTLIAAHGLGRKLTPSSIYMASMGPNLRNPSVYSKPSQSRKGLPNHSIVSRQIESKK